MADARGGVPGSTRTPRRGLPLRQVLGGLVTVVLLLAVALFWVTIVQLRTASDRNDAEHERVESFRIADQMRQSSNDLTRMVRLYVTTGEPRFRAYYDRILAIRRGTAPRPVHYDSSFWDRVLADGYAGVRVGPPVSLIELMRRAGFSDPEFDALGASLSSSDRLAEVEQGTMSAVAPRIARGTGGTYASDVAPEYRRLVDGEYHREKRRIMAAIERFTDLVDARTAERSSGLQDRTDRLLVAQSAVLVLLALVLVALLVFASRAIVRPLERLTAVTRRIRGGDWSEHAAREGVREIRELAGDFDEMTDAVQRELRGRERVEKEALEAQRRLREIADRVPGAVFQFHVDPDAALSVRFASRDTSVHGVGRDGEVDFPAVARSVLPEDRGGWLDSLVAVARTGGTWEREYRIVTQEGEVAWMRGHALARRAPDGSTDLYGYVHDVSVQKALESDLLRAREAAEGADRAKSAFLAMMSHELRTPLVAVTGTLEVLALDDLEDRHRERVDVATRSARSLLAVIGDVLDFSKIEAGHLELHPAPASVARVAADLVAQHAPGARHRGLALDVTVLDGLPPAHLVDAARLRQVLGNLVGNAIKFTAEGRVEVVVGPGPDGTVELLVRDTGIGVSAADQARLFAPFTQASTEASRRSDGTGLGLVISRQLVDAMGGTLIMESVAGAGTTMRVVLPLPVADPASLPADGTVVRRRVRPSRERAADEGSLVLLVEDHPVNRAVLAAQIEAVGVVVDVAADASEAEERFEDERYGLVFTDIQLPGVDGYELAGRLRAAETAGGRARTPIVALTAGALRGEDDRCRAAGMDDLVTKPTTLAALDAALRRWLPHLDRPAAGASPGGAAIDRSVLDELTGGDPELAEQVLESYVASIGDDLADLCRARDADDAPAAGRVAHRMGSAARMVGAVAVADAAEGLEAAVLTDAPGWSALVGALEDAAADRPVVARP